MTLKEKIERAEERLDEAVRNDDTTAIDYWRGYIDALKSCTLVITKKK